MSSHPVSDAIRTLYETYPYPPRIPGGSADPFLELIWAFSQHSRPGRRSFFDAGCGSGINVLGGALLYPHFDVYGCDLNRVTLDGLRTEAEALNLKNLHLQEMDLLHLDPEFGPVEGFDVIYSTGVIHHTPNPVGVLKSLAGRLAPQGVLRLMVYGDLGRSDLYRFARVARQCYGPESGSWPERVAQARELMRELASSGGHLGPFAPPSLRGPWQDALEVDDIEFADRYLNPHDQPFTIPTLKKAIEEAGLQFLDWFEPREWDLELLLPEFATRPEAPTDLWSRATLIEQLFDRPRLDLYLVGPKFERRRLQLSDQTYLGLNPQLFLNCVKARGVSFHRAAQLRLGKESVLSREEGILLESLGLRFMPLQAIVAEMPNPGLDHWRPIVQRLLDLNFLFSPHPLQV